MAVYDALELRLDDGEMGYVRVPDHLSPETALEQLLQKQANYAGWVKVEDPEEPRYVRYERIASVTIVRGIDDTMPPPVESPQRASIFEERNAGNRTA